MPNEGGLQFEWWRGDGADVPEEHKPELIAEALRRASSMINDGYISGELHCEIEDVNYRGHWEFK